jgi:hypothetical protein
LKLEETQAGVKAGWRRVPGAEMSAYPIHHLSLITVPALLARNFHFSPLTKEKRVNFVQFHIFIGQNDQF